MDKLTDPMFGNIEPDSTVDLYYNLSTESDGNSQQGDKPWNSAPDFKYVANPTASHS
jgi:Mn-containing catalase